MDRRRRALNRWIGNLANDRPYKRFYAFCILFNVTICAWNVLIGSSWILIAWQILLVAIPALSFGHVMNTRAKARVSTEGADETTLEAIASIDFALSSDFVPVEFKAFLDQEREEMIMWLPEDKRPESHFPMPDLGRRRRWWSKKSRHGQVDTDQP